MSNPWDIPPLPTAGDLNPDHTYAGVGRIMSAWETIEYELCMIHSGFCGDPAGEAMRLYGAKRNFPGRLRDLSKASEAYIVRNPSQDREGEFDRLLEEVLRYYDRRNEVAHGTVIAITRLSYYRDHLTDPSPPTQYAVIPPYHMARSHGVDGLPLYAYTSVSLETLLAKLMALWDKLKAYRKSLP